MKKLLLLMVAVCMTLAVGAQGTSKFNGNVQLKKATTEMSVAKRQAKKSAGMSAFKKNNVQRSVALQGKTDFKNLRLRKGTGIKKASLDLTADEFTKIYYSDTKDWWHSLYVSEDECEFFFDVLTSNIVSGKTYTSDNGDFDLNYSYALIGDDGYEALSIDFTWTKNDDGSVKVVGHMTLETGDKYTVTYYKAPTPQTVGTVTRTLDNAAFTDGTATLGIFQFSGEAGEEYYAIACASDGTIAGTYEFNQLQSLYTYISPDEETYIDVIDGTVTVTVTDENYICHAKVIGEDLILYDLTFIVKNDDNKVLDYDCEDQDFYYEFGRGCNLSIDDEYIDFGVAYLDVETASGDLYACLEFNITETDPEIIIPEGVYTINRTYDYGTVTGSEGIDDDGYLTPSFVINCDEEGYAVEPLWFIVSGTVTVVNENGKLNVTVDGLNSFGRTVHFTVRDDSTPLPPPAPGQNLVNNGGFESWADTTQPQGWTGWQIAEKSNTGGAQLKQSTDSHSGDYACYVEGASSNKRLATQKLTLPADTYVVSFWAKSDDGGIIKPGMATVQGNGSANYNYGDFANDGISLTSSWKQYSYEFTLSEETEVSMIVMNYKNSGNFLIDDYVLVSKTGYTGINKVESNTVSNSLFNIAGQSVSEDYKGIVISGGKKYLKK